VDTDELEAELAAMAEDMDPKAVAPAQPLVAARAAGADIAAMPEPPTLPVLPEVPTDAPVIAPPAAAAESAPGEPALTAA